MSKIAHLPDRGVLQIAGPDRVNFLQGLVSNDVTAAKAGHAVWAAMLTPQGKWLADFFIFAEGERLLLDCERAQIQDIARRLARFRLRSQIEIADVSESLFVHASWSETNPFSHTHLVTLAPDPRLPAAGSRVMTSAPIDTNATAAEWDAHRLALGLPDGSRDLESEKSILLEAGFDELSGVSWTKGCYMGQELTARTKYRGLVKRRLVPVVTSGPPPSPGAPILRDGHEVGSIRSVQGNHALALLRIDAIGAELICAQTSINAVIPEWMKFSPEKSPAKPSESAIS